MNFIFAFLFTNCFRIFVASDKMANQDENLDQADYEIFRKFDTDNSGFVTDNELAAALNALDIRVPQYEVRRMIADNEVNVRDGKLDFIEFKRLCGQLRADRDMGAKFKGMVKARTDLKVHGGMTEVSAEGTTHSVADSEMRSFSDWININCQSDPICKKYLPLSIEHHDLYQKVGDGILLCKLINLSEPNTIDFRALNLNKLDQVYRCRENLVLAINSAGSIGCQTVNMHPEDFQSGKPHIVLGLIWQVIRIGLLTKVSLKQVPGIVRLMLPGESLDDIGRLRPEEILLRWVNYHLQQAGCARRVANFSDDIKDSEAYIYLLHQIAPRDRGVTTMALRDPNDLSRAEAMLREADKIDCRRFVTSRDVVGGNPKLNLAFVANLFNQFPALEDPEEPLDMEVYEESREEKTYRNWMNSLGVQPSVYHLYNDMQNGLIIFQLFDIIRPGIVEWSKVIKQFNKMRVHFERLQNCNYAVELGKQLQFSLVGIGGADILEGNRTLTLALVWQLMRAYTLAVLTQLAATGQPISDREIILWANKRLKDNGKNRQFVSFQDRATLGDGLLLLDLIETIQPHSVDYGLVASPAATGELCLSNAQYAITMGRKIGARIYALPEDVVECKPKMMLTIFACLMMRDLQRRAAGGAN